MASAAAVMSEDLPIHKFRLPKRLSALAERTPLPSTSPCSAFARDSSGDGQHTCVRPSTSHRLRVICAAEGAEYHNDLLEGVACAQHARVCDALCESKQFFHCLTGRGHQRRPGDIAHDDQCGMEEVLQHTLRICR